MSYPWAAHPLDTGDPFPTFSMTIVESSDLTLPKRGRWTLLTIYRGEW